MRISFGISFPEKCAKMKVTTLISRQNPLFQEICFFGIFAPTKLKFRFLLLFPCDMKRKLLGFFGQICRTGMLESFCTIYQRNSEIFFLFRCEKNITQHFVPRHKQKQKLFSPRSLWTKAGSTERKYGRMFTKGTGDHFGRTPGEEFNAKST